MIQSLIILGFLKKGPASGYDIRKFINKELGVFSKFDNQSIYYPLKQMATRGLITGREARGAQDLKKQLYSLTPKGEQEFNELCRRALLSQERPFMETDVVLYFLPYLDPHEVIPLLRLRLRFLQKVRQWLAQKRTQLASEPKNLKLLLDHHARFAHTEKEFLQELISYLKQEL